MDRLHQGYGRSLAAAAPPSASPTTAAAVPSPAPAPGVSALAGGSATAAAAATLAFSADTFVLTSDRHSEASASLANMTISGTTVPDDDVFAEAPGDEAAAAGSCCCFQ